MSFALSVPVPVWFVRLTSGLTLAATLILSTPTIAQPAVTAPPGSVTAPIAADSPLRPLIAQPAPPLKIAHWVKGDAVKGFEKGKAYVIEFWATWCGPCIQNIPKLTALQARYKDQLVVIGISSSDQAGIDAVRPFVERMGDKMTYTVAVDDAAATSAAYMAAVNQNSIPHAFIIDKTGKVAWYGHPANNMEGVLAQVVEGTFDPKTYVDPQLRLAELTEQVATAGRTSDWALADKSFAEMRLLRPEIARNIDLWRFNFLYATRKDKVLAMQFASELLKGPVNDDAMALTGFHGTVTSDPAPTPEAIALALRTMERSVELTGRKDARLLSILADAQSRAIKYDIAIATIDEALALATDPGTRKVLEIKRNGYAEAKASPPMAPSPSDSSSKP